MTNEKIASAAERENDKKIAQELVDKLDGMSRDTANKLESAKEQFVAKLDILSAKYKTANGIKAAMDVVYSLLPANTEIRFKYTCSVAQENAKKMSAKCAKLRDKAKGLDYMDLKNITDGEYDEDVTDLDYGIDGLSLELMNLELMANIGPNADDISEFCERANSEMDDVKDELNELLEKYPEFKDLKPTPRD